MVCPCKEKLRHLGHEYHMGDPVSFSEHHIRWHMMSVCHITGDAKLDHIVKAVFTGLLCHKATLCN